MTILNLIASIVVMSSDATIPTVSTKDLVMQGCNPKVNESTIINPRQVDK